jgi:hypothetical protein
LAEYHRKKKSLRRNARTKRGAELKLAQLQRRFLVPGLQEKNLPIRESEGAAIDEVMPKNGTYQGTFRRAATLTQLMLAFFLAVSAVALNAQVKGEKTSLELGSVTVWLGMPRQEVVKRCATAGYSVSNGPGDELVIRDSEKMTTDSHIFRVIFKDDRVTYASRNWYSSKAKPFEAVLGALEQLADRRASGCLLVHDQDKSPDSAWDMVYITCGLRRVLIESGNTNGESVAAVYEQIDSRER